ncbi:MAG: di-trans,poly-cis-decaprenylcistransferase [Acidobacteria bacterium]|nr:di-trans,poly-cis-decaprenylcistransferase [Acidobacteriota bacterium]
MKIREEAGIHVAIIMDGNGRWATRQGLSRVAGHRAGVAAVRRTVESAPDLGVRVLTIYAFSSDNWARPAQEVESIFWIIRAFLRLECERLRKNGVRLEVIGRRDRIPRALLREIENAEKATAMERTLHLRIAIDYSAQASIAEAVVAVQGIAGEVTAERMRSIITQRLTADCGDVDLLIRTGGEKRLSDYLLWESAYAELFFTDRMWPEFEGSDLVAAVYEFRHRERRFGAVPVLKASSMLVAETAQ